MHVCEFVDADARTTTRMCTTLMALGHANLVARSSTPEKPRPTLLFGEKSVSHEDERAFILLMDFLN